MVGDIVRRCCGRSWFPTWRESWKTVSDLDGALCRRRWARWRGLRDRWAMVGRTNRRGTSRSGGGRAARPVAGGDVRRPRQRALDHGLRRDPGVGAAGSVRGVEVERWWAQPAVEERLLCDLRVVGDISRNMRVLGKAARIRSRLSCRWLDYCCELARPIGRLEP